MGLNKEQRSLRRNEIIKYRLDNPEMTLQEIASHFGNTRQYIYIVLTKENKRRIQNDTIDDYFNVRSTGLIPTVNSRWKMTHERLIQEALNLGYKCHYCGEPPVLEDFPARVNYYTLRARVAGYSNTTRTDRWWHSDCRHKAIWQEFICPQCGISFERNRKVQKWHDNERRQKGYTDALHFCGHSCQFAYYWTNHHKNMMVNRMKGTKVRFVRKPKIKFARINQQAYEYWKADG